MPHNLSRKAMNIQKYLKSAGVVGLSTLASRFLGLVRDMALASVFGASFVLDAFLLAFTIPNLFRQFFGEGAVSSAFLPVFSDVLEKQGPAQAWRMASKTITMLTVFLLILMVLGIGICLGLSALPDIAEKDKLALELCGYMMPYLVLICLAAFLGAVLNSLDHFLTPALSPIVLNIFWIASIFVLAPLFGPKQQHWAYAMAAAILLSGVVQVILQYPALKQKHAQLQFCWDWEDSNFQRVLLQLGPILLGAAAVQINVVVDRLVAWFWIPGDGALTVLYMGNRLMQFPLAIIGISVATVAFPWFSRLVARGELSELAKAIPAAMRLTFLVSFPASFGLIILAHPIIALIYGHQQFDQQAVLRTTYVLIAYSSGLWLYILMQIVLKAFYALGDTKTPMIISLCAVLTNLTWNLCLVGIWQEAGLAMATAFNALLQVTVLIWLLQKKIALDWQSTWTMVWKCLLSTCLMCIMTYFAADMILALIHSKILAVCLPVLLGIFVYFGACKYLGIQELNLLFHRRNPNEK